LPQWGTKVVLWLIITYWIVRNIPYEPLTLLAPHRLEDPVTQQDNQKAIASHDR
jgi:hypothetical protein